MDSVPLAQRDIVKIVPSALEKAAGVLETQTVENAARHFRADGALLVEDVVNATIINESRRVFGEAYSSYIDGKERDDTLVVGDRRLLITINLEPPFDNPQLFANPFVLPILEAALDPGFVVGALGIVCSLPSAPGQHIHADGGFLFSRTALDRLLPASAITLGIPLIEMNDVNGTTALWLGSHHDASRVPEEKPIKPIVREGSCLFWDFRLSHGGTPNNGTIPRPLFYITYCRPWFWDHVNFSKRNPKQKPLLASNDLWPSLSEQHQQLLTRVRSGSVLT